MKCLINCKDHLARWVNEYFNDVPPYMLKVLNKPLLEYYIDFCSLLKIEEIRIISDDPDVQVEEYFGNGLKWGIKISYGFAKTTDTLKDIYLKNEAFCDNSDLFIIDGFVFIDYHRETSRYIFFSDENPMKSLQCNTGRVLSVRYDKTKSILDQDDFVEITNAGFEIKELSNIQQYYELSLDILKHKAGNFVLPGYNNEPDVFIGQNVEMAKNIECIKPVMIGNNVRIRTSAMIGPNTIIGNNVMVDSSTNIDNSIVYDYSYIGSDLEIKNKIVYKNSLISPNSGEIVKISDKFITSGINRLTNTSFIRRTVHYFIALLMFMIQLIPFCLLYPLDRIFNGSLNGFFRRIFLKFSMDKFLLLPKVFAGRLYLVGNKRSLNTSDELPYYHPAIFYYSEMMSDKVGLYQIQMDELYYCNNISLRLDIKILFRTLINRFFI